MPDDDKIQPKKKDQPNRITIQKYAFCEVIINPGLFFNNCPVVSGIELYLF